MITGYVRRQALAVSAPVLVADTIDYLTARFVFMTGDWDGLEVWAHFRQGDTAYDFRLDEDGEITADQHLNLTEGAWSVYLTGHLYSGGAMLQRISTQAAGVKVVKSGMANANPFPPLPATVEEQIFAELEDHEERLSEIEKNGTGGGGGTGEITGAVRYDVLQELTEEQQMQARENMGLYWKGVEYAKVATYGYYPDFNFEKSIAGANNVVVEIYKTGTYEVEAQDYQMNYMPMVGEVHLWWMGNANLITGIDGIPDETKYADLPFCWYRYCDEIYGAGDKEELILSNELNNAAYDYRNENDGYFAIIRDVDDKQTIYHPVPDEYIPDTIARKKDIPDQINTALAQAKESGEFDGAPGKDYILTDADKTEIAQQAAVLVDTALLSIIGTGEVTA